jgi:multiple sugar transport system permease protein
MMTTESEPLGQLGIARPLPDGERPKSSWIAQFRRSNTPFSLALLAPAVLLLGALIAYPLARSIVISFQLYDLTQPDKLMQWVGFANYEFLLASGLYLNSMRITLLYSVGMVGGSFLIGFALAILLNQPLRLRNYYRGIFLLPWVSPPVTAALLWWWIYNNQNGILNLTLKQMHLIGNSIPWIGAQEFALYAVILASIWRYFPFHMVMLLAGLQAVPQQLHDAAAVDGANAVQRFRHVTLPHMRNIIVTVLLLTFIWSFQEFTMIWSITSGGPGFNTRTISLFVYETAFNFFRMGQAAAAGSMWLVLLLVVSVVVMRFGLARERMS